MQAPQLMNPPPQIFGGYNGLQDLDLGAQMFGDGGLLDDSVEAKRRRIARVCLFRILMERGRGKDIEEDGLV